MAKLNGSGVKVGPSLVLKVMSGDKIDIGVQSLYRQQGGGGSLSHNNPAQDILLSLANGIVSVIGTTHGTEAQLSNTSSTPLLGALSSLLSNRDTTTAPSKPRAYLNWILLNEQFKPVNTYPQSGAMQVRDTGELATLAYSGIPITKSGYLYIYISNETENWNVFFDNLLVNHYTGPLLEETHYYPFGLAMAGISSRAAGRMANRHKFNGGNELQSGEFSDGNGLEMYDAVNRLYDPQIGRFVQIDEFSDGYWEWSTYSFGLDNPISVNDPLGLEGEHPIHNEKKKNKLKKDETAKRDLDPVYVTAPHSKKVLKNTYWHYKNNNIPFSKAPKDIRNWLYKYDRVEQHMQRVYAMRREQDEVFLEAASFFIPTGWILKLKYLKYAKYLFQAKRLVNGGKRGKIVLGRLIDYEAKAQQVGGRIFKITDKTLENSEVWRLNLKFLDDAIARGDDIVLATHVSKAEQGSVFWQELQYLFARGYKVAEDGLSLIK